MTELPENWDTMPAAALYDELNSVRRFGTPQSTIDAIMFAVRQRGPSALNERANIERLARCDERARAQINAAIAALLQKETSP